MTRRVGLTNKATYGRGKTHVRHAVGFVDNDRRHRLQIEVVLLEEVLKSTWACDDDVNTH